MKQSNKIYLLLLFIVSSLSLSSCDSDGYFYLGLDSTDRLTNKFWEGDVDRVVIDGRDKIHLISTFIFYRDNTGIEELRYLNGELYHKDVFTWIWESDRVGDFIEIRYGRGDYEYMDEVYLRSRKLHAVHYLDGYDFENRRNGLPITLRRR